MRIVSAVVRSGVLLGALLGFSAASYGQAPDDQEPVTKSGIANLSTEALRANSEIIAHLGTRIVGGQPVAIKDHPWQVGLIRGFLAEPQRSQFCGGSLIDGGWVLTAAHCVRNSLVREDPTRLNIVAGTAAYLSGGERIEVAEIHVHDKYNQTTMDHDFALLRLAKPATIDGTTVTKPIKPADASTTVKVRTRAWVTGWGATAESSPGAVDLLGVEVPVVSNATCNKPDSYNGDILNSMMCAGHAAGGIDSCQGDSGGPLSATLPGSTEPTLIGVVSWGEGCARRLKYGVYSRVSMAAGWISSTMSTRKASAASAPGGTK
jgi:secreted trypsin-like serine protease